MKKQSKRRQPGADIVPLPVAATPASGRSRLLICVLLAALTFAAYSQAGSWRFVNLDDDAYVEFQPMVNQGLRPAAIEWAFTATHSNNWHPLTSFSHMLDCSLFGLTPGPMHLENVIWHLLNAELVFLVLSAATGSVWRSAVVAGLFALHPAHVESVAWISERKDVLSTFFWLLGLGVYVRYVRAPSAHRYSLVALFLVLGLLCKPMLVTFPLTLLMFDFWPSGRYKATPWRKLVVEKVPLFFLVLIHALVTLAVQVSTGAAQYGVRFSFAARLGNAFVSFVRYIGKCIWPHPLAPHYDHPGWWPWWAVIASVIIVAFITVLAWKLRRPFPWFLFGWGWFLITLLPVIGLVQVGAQSMADRYTYVSFIGLFVVAVWSCGEWVEQVAWMRGAAAVLTVLLLGDCLIFTRRQASTWQDSMTLYEKCIDHGTDNATVRYLLGVAWQKAGRPEAETAGQFQRAITLSPSYTNAYTQLALLAIAHRDLSGAERLIEKTIQLEPTNAMLRKNLGILRNMQGRPDEARAELDEALKLAPRQSDLRYELAWMDWREGRAASALSRLETVVRQSPWDFAALTDLGGWYLRLGRREEARRCLEKALWINPAWDEAKRTRQQL